MKEDLSLSKSALLRTQEENQKLVAQLQRLGTVQEANIQLQTSKASSDVAQAASGGAGASAPTEQVAKLITEKDTLEKDLRLQVSFLFSMSP